jgi:hypothetical protein
MATEEMAYCEGCSAKIPLKMNHCPYCGIEKPYISKYSHKQSSSIRFYAITSSTDNTGVEESRPSSSKGSQVYTSSASPTQTNGFRRYPSAIATSSENSDKIDIRPVLVQAVNEYNGKEFHKARDLTESNKLLDWRASIIYALSLMRLIETQETESGLEHFTNEVLLAVVKPLRDVSIKQKIVENSIARFVIHRAMIYAINNIGTDLIFIKTTNSGNCVFKNGNYYDYQLLRLRTFVNVLQGIHDLSFSQNTSNTIILLSTLIIRLESGCRTGLSTTRLKALRLSHKQKCTNPQFLKALETSNHVIKMSFFTKPLKITSESPLDGLVARRIEYNLG